MQKIFRFWFASLILITLVAGFVYVSVQQSYRHAADDPQIEMSHDTADSLNHGIKFAPSKLVDLANYSSPFTIIYNMKGNIVASEAVLHGKNPELPSGVLDSAKEHGENRLTWQPENGVRIAADITKFNNGYVLVGRSLNETEQRESQLEQGVALFWFVSNIIMLVVITAITPKKGK